MCKSQTAGARAAGKATLPCGGCATCPALRVEKFAPPVAGSGTEARA